MKQPTVKESALIPGLLHIDLVVLEDSRGSFKEGYQRKKLVAQGLPKDFEITQNNISVNNGVGVTRGVHAEPLDKYITLATGNVFVAYVDLRAGPNFGTLETTELTPHKAIFLPRGVGNSFQTLTSNVVYTYLWNGYWSPDAQYSMCNLADPKLGINWPIDLDSAIISEKDKNHPRLDGVKPMEV